MSVSSMQREHRRPPLPGARAGGQALRALLAGRSVLGALQALHAGLGDVFRLPLPGFNAVMVAGPEANRLVYIDGRDRLRWRNDRDPVTRLLRHGVLVEDGERHDALRELMTPVLHRGRVLTYAAQGAMWQQLDRVAATWPAGGTVDMLAEMRRVALLILARALFGVDLWPDLPRLWPAILRTIDYISPGPWIVWPGVPRPGYRRALATMDDYLYGLIRARRAAGDGDDDLIGRLIRAPGMNDDLIRDQLLTMLIAGHDTSTALLAWSLYLLGSHPAALAAAQAEVRAVVGDAEPSAEQMDRLEFLDRVIREALRLYPPIHVSNRVAVQDLDIGGYRIRAGTRVMASIYLAQRDPRVWEQPDHFWPDRFLGDRAGRPPLAYVPFGGGPRHCLGATFAQVEVRLVLARLLQTFELELVDRRVHAHMGATLEPRPGVRMQVNRRFHV